MYNYRCVDSTQQKLFGMIVHWYDHSTLQRCKAAICCTRLVGHHTYDALASKIESIHRSYSLNGKITVTVTDNGSNFVKAFKTFSVTDLTSTSAEVTQEEYCSEEGHPDEEEANFENVHDTLTLEQQNMDDLTQVEYGLPAHEMCADHTMNLVASSDIISRCHSHLYQGQCIETPLPNALHSRTKPVDLHKHQTMLKPL